MQTIEKAEILIANSPNDLSWNTVDEPLYKKLQTVKQIHLGKKFNKVKQFVFGWCPELVSITVDNDNKYYKSIDRIVYSNDVTILVACPRSRTKPLVMPSEVKVIRTASFYKCKITTVEFNKNLELIEAHAFTHSKLKAVDLSKTKVHTIQNVAFCCDDVKDTVLTLQDLETSGNVEKIVLPSTLQSMWDRAFISAKIKTLTIPASVKKIGTSVFYGLENLEKVIFDSAETVVASCAFGACKKLKEIISPSEKFSIKILKSARSH